MKIKTRMKLVPILLALVCALLTIPALAAPTATEEVPAAQMEQVETAQDSSLGMKAIGSGVAIGLAALGGALGMGLLGSKAAEGIARQPEAEGKIRTTLMLTLVFIETAIIYALLVVILIIFVL